MWRNFGSTGILAIKETSGLFRQDAQRPGGLTLIHVATRKVVSVGSQRR